MPRPRFSIALLLVGIATAVFALPALQRPPLGTPSVVAQEQSLMPAPMPTVSWLLENPQSIGSSSILCPSGFRCDAQQSARMRASQRTSLDELSRFSLSFDQKKRPIIHYRFVGGTATAGEGPDEP